jgi:hypothetical protein
MKPTTAAHLDWTILSMNDHGVTLDFGSSMWKRDEPDPASSGAEILSDLIAYYSKYVRLRPDEYTAMACWVLHCHAFPAFSRTPYLNVSSPAEGCGKTQLLEITEPLVPEALLVSSTTSAVLSRAIHAFLPVLLLDELDKLQEGDKDLLAAVLATINSGYKKSGYRLLLEPVKGGGWKPKKLSTFCPKILCGINSLPKVTRSRCIPIAMERMLPGDRVHDVDEFITEPEARKLFHRAKDWAAQNLEKLRKARPDSPNGLGHRQREVCRPLFAIADICGAEWGEKVRAAIGRLFSTDAALPDDDINTRLLQDIRECFSEADRISSAELIEKLVSMEDAPWSSWGKSHKPINQNQLSGRLRHFKVSSRPIRIAGRVPRGYLREQFESAWERYVHLTPPQGATVLQAASTQAESDFSGCYKNSAVALQKSEIANIHPPCSTVALQKPEVGGVQQRAGEKTNGKPASEVRCPNCGSRDFYRGPGNCLACGIEPEFAHVQ